MPLRTSKCYSVATSLLIAITVVGFAHLARAEVNAGFIEQAIWFSNEPDTVGEKTNVSTLINNQDAKAIYGMVSFYDNSKLVSKKAATVDAHASKVVMIPWTVTEGKHSFVVKYEDTRYTNEKGTATIVSNNETSPYTFTVVSEAQKVTDAKTTTSKAEDQVKQTAGEVKDAAEGAFAKFDSFREDTATSLEGKVLGATKAVEDTKKAEAAKPAKDRSALQTPFAYLKLYFFKLAHFIFSSIYAFYGLIFLIIILFVRYLIRAPR